MKRLLIVLFISLTISIASLITPPDVSAQPTPCDPSTGANCCDPSTGENCYFCEWSPVQLCISRQGTIGGWPPSYLCTYGDVPDEGYCNSLNENDCAGALSLTCITPDVPTTDCTHPNLCVGPSGCPAGSEVGGDCTPDTWICCESCAYCDNVTNVCVNAPAGSALCEFGNISECQASSCGFTAPRYSCENNRCIEGSTGPYASAGECRLDGCESPRRQNPNTQPVFCGGSTDPEVGSIDTALGCIPVGCPANDPDCPAMQNMISFLLVWGMGIAGGLGFLLIVYSGFLIMTSSGDPKKLSAGKELLSAAIAGLLLLILGTYLLRVIGVDILGIF